MPINIIHILGAATEPERDRIENEMNESHRKERVRTLGHACIYTHKSEVSLTSHNWFFSRGGLMLHGTSLRAGGHVCYAWSKDPNIEFILWGKMKIEKKRKEEEVTCGPNLPRPTSTRGLWGLNFFCRLKIYTHPAKKCGLCRFDPASSTRFAFSNKNTHTLSKP